MTVSQPQAEILRESNLPGADLIRRGKVRDLYSLDKFGLDDRLLVVVSDRLSAFDVVLPGGIPDKGRVLTRLSLWWFDLLAAADDSSGFAGVEHHLISGDVDSLPEALHDSEDQLRNRMMLVEKLEILPVECIVRGYVAGSGWSEYQKKGTITGIELPKGLVNSSQLPEPIFTPSTKAEEGHDENIPFAEVVDMIGRERAEKLRDLSLQVYKKAAGYARGRGIIIADTKFEWGVRPSTGEIVLADEVLTPDSSRFWPEDQYEPGKSQPSYDKQYVRDYLLTLDWDRTPPGPKLPAEVVQETSAKYRELYERMTGLEFGKKQES